jgi:hypothetical protein
MPTAVMKVNKIDFTKGQSRFDRIRLKDTLKPSREMTPSNDYTTRKQYGPPINFMTRADMRSKSQKSQDSINQKPQNTFTKDKKSQPLC